MDKQVTISKTPSAAAGENYADLYRKGIGYIQQFGSDQWTDYNLHDPGVTILEMLTYTFTELAYKAGFDIADLLTTADGQTQLRTCGLYSARQVLTTNPLTVNDWRRFIMDSSPMISNAWVYAHPDTGAMDVYMLLHDNCEDPEKIEQDVWKLLTDYNNTGERPGVVKALKKVLLRLTLDVSLDRSARPEETIAQFLFNISDFLSPMVHFSTLVEMQNTGIPSTAIFDGPGLNHGFIADSELQDKTAQITISEMIRIIKSTPGVIGINRIRMDVGDEEAVSTSADGSVSLHTDYIADLDFDFALEQLVVQVDGNQLAINQANISNVYQQMESSEHRAFRLTPRAEEMDFADPEGRYRNPGSYYSLQENFPVIYGTSSAGLPPNATDQRRAQAYQLKAYLLFFEQILANNLSQLENLSQVYSLSEQRSMYHLGKLYQVPDVAPLLRSYTDYYKLRKSSNRTDASIWAAFTADDSNTYVLQTTQAMRQTEDFAQRRINVLDFLLSLYNQHPQVYAPPLESEWKVSAQHPEIQIKEEYLRNYPKLGAERSLAGDMERPGGAEQALRVLLSIPHRPEIPISEMVDAFVKLSPATGSEDNKDSGLYHFFQMTTRDSSYSVDQKDSGTECILNLGGTALKIQEDKDSTRAYKKVRRFQQNMVKLSSKAENFYVLDHADFKEAAIGTGDIEEAFFHYSMSFIFPGFTLRFGDKAFRNYVESLILDYTPAHIRPFVYWLDIDQLRVFEQHYYELRNTKFGTADNLATTAEMKSVLTFLYQLYQELPDNP